jgi:ATP-dependent RNA helicase HelY
MRRPTTLSSRRRCRSQTTRPGRVVSKPRLTPGLEKLFKQIGVPAHTAFRPDPFQFEALEALQHGDVLVSAPTGSGKTWIAQEGIRGYLDRGRRCWYASPLKALSNSKFAEFSAVFGTQNVGILTGDRKENPDAPLIVGTTEILRNQLYDAMMEGQDILIDLAVIDEAHYLNDADRGVVWEEVLIYLPARVRLLLLSATVGNSEEIRHWLETIRDVRCHVVESKKRPVPLHFLFLFPDGEISPLANRRGILPKIRKFLTVHGPSRPRRFAVPPRFGWVIEQLRTWDLLPAIFFLKSRADCDHAIEADLSRYGLQRHGNTTFRGDLKEFVNQYPYLKGHRQLPYLERFRAGSHHGGHLPQWKLLIEEMMNRGHLDAIFSTSTVAAGVNFPARTVVLVQSDRLDGQRFADLTATELHQMTGRAGRRGKDRVGFALILPGLYQDPVLIHHLMDSPPEPIRSQIQISFSMVLNLLLSHRPTGIRDLLEKSLAAFQDQRSHPDLRKQWTRLAPKLRAFLPENLLDDRDPLNILAAVRAQMGLKERIEYLKTQIALDQRDVLFSHYLRRGRLFVHRKGRTYVAFHTFYRGQRSYCSAHPVGVSVKGRKGGIKLRSIPLESIDHLLDFRVDIPEEVSKESLRAILFSIPVTGLTPIRVAPEMATADEEELRRAESEMAALPDFDELKHQVRSDKAARTALRQVERLALETDRHRHHLWNEFIRHLEFIKETGFVDAEDRLTSDGRWASCLRLDHPLLIAEAIRKGILDESDPPTLAGLLAPFVVDKTRDVEVRCEGMPELQDLSVLLNRMGRQLYPLQRLKRQRGFETLPIQFWPAAAVLLWARGQKWDVLLQSIAVEEGDMAALVLRTADHLRQLFDLAETHPSLARTARQALPLILREPVLVP